MRGIVYKLIKIRKIARDVFLSTQKYGAVYCSETHEILSLSFQPFNQCYFMFKDHNYIIFRQLQTICNKVGQSM